MKKHQKMEAVIDKEMEDMEHFLFYKISKYESLKDILPWGVLSKPVLEERTCLRDAGTSWFLMPT